MSIHTLILHYIIIHGNSVLNPHADSGHHTHTHTHKYCIISPPCCNTSYIHCKNSLNMCIATCTVCLPSSIGDISWASSWESLGDFLRRSISLIISYTICTQQHEGGGEGRGGEGRGGAHSTGVDFKITCDELNYFRKTYHFIKLPFNTTTTRVEVKWVRVQYHSKRNSE